MEPPLSATTTPRPQPHRRTGCTQLRLAGLRQQVGQHSLGRRESTAEMAHQAFPNPATPPQCRRRPLKAPNSEPYRAAAVQLHPLPLPCQAPRGTRASVRAAGRPSETHSRSQEQGSPGVRVHRGCHAREDPGYPRQQQRQHLRLRHASARGRCASKPVRTPSHCRHAEGTRHKGKCTVGPARSFPCRMLLSLTRWAQGKRTAARPCVYAHGSEA